MLVAKFQLVFRSTAITFNNLPAIEVGMQSLSVRKLASEVYLRTKNYYFKNLAGISGIVNKVRTRSLFSSAGFLVSL